MNFVSRHGGGRLDPAEIRLPLIALIDIILFLLMYFMLAGSLDGEEATLGTNIAAQSSVGMGSDLPPAVIDIRPGASGRPEFVLGARVFNTRAELTEALRLLPPSQTLMLRASDDAPVAAVATAAQATKDAGFLNVSFLAPPRPLTPAGQ
jgi:biopolymer transport protein ExbD